AAPHARGLELDAQWLAIGALDVGDEIAPIGQPSLDDERLVRGEELPVEKVVERTAVHREQLGGRHNADLVGDAAWCDATDANHEPGCVQEGETALCGLPLWACVGHASPHLAVREHQVN